MCEVENLSRYATEILSSLTWRLSQIRWHGEGEWSPIGFSEYPLGSLGMSKDNLRANGIGWKFVV